MGFPRGFAVMSCFLESPYWRVFSHLDAVNERGTDLIKPNEDIACPSASWARVLCGLMCLGLAKSEFRKLDVERALFGFGN